MSDEIGHFENCLAIDANGNCTSPGAQDANLGLGRHRLRSGTDSTLVKINDCTAADEDWDGQSYRLDWPGTNPNPFLDRALHPTPVLFTSPLTQRQRTTRPSHSRPTCRASKSRTRRPTRRSATGLPVPTASTRRPARSSTRSSPPRSGQGVCTWQEGGRFIPGTVNNFGGSSTAEFGPLLRILYPEPGFTTAVLINNFNSGDLRNPCRA